ncbi:MAG: DUF21 domain-containing protein [Mycoplasmataceae bacterium]|nr:DUF21 domain-containing protein [Mycoplasmataceae bacterium]
MEILLYLSGIFILLLLVALSALFSFSEMAISSANKITLKAISESKNSSKISKKRATRVIHFIENYNEHISAIVIVNNVVNILFSTLATVYFTIFAQNILHSVAFGPLMAFLIMTPIVIIFGEIIPKQLAKKFPEIGTMKLSWTLQIVNMFLKPITYLLSKLIKEEKKNLLSSDEEINLALEDATSIGVTTSFEQNIIKRFLELDKSYVKNVMLPKKDVVTIPLNITKNKIDNILRKNSYTRLPMLNKNGEIKKIFSTKKYLVDKLRGETEVLKKYMYDFTKFNTDDNPFHIFESLRNKREKMAIIFDEHKVFVGIITVEDIIELMLGEIYDEYDVEEDGVYTLNETSFIVTPNVKVGYFIKKYSPEFVLKTEHKEKTFNQWIKIIAGKTPILNEHYIFKNMIIWVQQDKMNEKKIIFEIDIV